MKRTFSMLCGAIALLCLISMFMPIVAPKYSAQYYQPGSDGYARDYMLIGDYYCAREYWSLARFAMSNGHRIAISAAMGLLLYWAALSFMGEKARIIGVVAATVNLGVTGYLIVSLIRIMSACRPFVIGVIVVDAVTAAAVAWIGLFTREKRRYISVPVRRH